MYPRNAENPEPILIGAVVQRTDGAVQTSGVTVRIKPVGVAEADGLGSIFYSTDGMVYYTPTQSETNYTSFLLIASKAGCYPVGITVITSAAATAGQVRLEATTHTGAVIPTVTAVSNGVTLANNAVTAAALATDAVNEIQSGLATSTLLNTVDGKVDTVSSNVSTILGRITSGVAQMFQDLIAMITGSGTANAQWDAKSLELAPAGGGGGGGGDASQATLLEVQATLLEAKAKTDLIGATSTLTTAPVTAEGRIPIVIAGDDYLVANGRAFSWTINAIPGMTAASCAAHLTFKSGAASISCPAGTVTDNGNQTWTVRVEMPRSTSSQFTQGDWSWTVGVSNSTSRITPVRSGRETVVRSGLTWQ